MPNNNNNLKTNRLSNEAHAKILLVDDNVDLLKLIAIRLRQSAFNIKTVTSSEEALSILAIWPADLIITDLQLPGMSGMELFDQLQQQNPLLPVIILTAYGTIPEAVQATQSGVASYLTKPFDSDTLIQHIQTALVKSGFNKTQTSTTNTQTVKESWRSKIYSKSPVMKALLDKLEKLADTKTSIILEGETGTGKTELARALHLCSNRSEQSFIKVDCARLPDDLLGINLFGRTADSDQNIKSHLGSIQKANDGTLLIHDFNDPPFEIKNKLLQAITDRKTTPINSNHSYSVGARLVITCDFDSRKDNDDLLKAARKADITRIKVPPLRDRREDIPLIIQRWLFVNEIAPNIQFSSAALQLLTAADWPGNVQQLLDVVKLCTRLSNTNIISAALVAGQISSPAFNIPPLSNAHRQFEREYLMNILKITNGNVTRAASIAKRNRTEFHRLLKKHQIAAESFRQRV